MIDHKELVANLAKPGEEIVASLTPDEAHILHMAIGISGECGEVLTAIIEDKRDDVKEELGDMEFYFEGLCQGLECEFPHVEIDIKPSADPFPYMLIQSAIVLDTAKKYVMYKDASKLPLLKNDLGVLREYMDSFYNLCKLKHDEVIAGNIAKLSNRYKSGTYSNDAARTRPDKDGE